jgi:hypothetical protein
MNTDQRLYGKHPQRDKIITRGLHLPQEEIS